MYIILGGTGHVGSAVATNLLAKNLPVTIVSRDESKGAEWRKKGAHVAVVDVSDTTKLTEVFATGEALFLLNPPALPSTNIDKEERETLDSILTAVRQSAIAKVVAQSTYGAQPGDGIGDLGVLYEMEQGLARLDIPVAIIRGAYYMSNWDMSLQSVADEGKLYSFFPAEFKLPMVAPEDLGSLAAEFLTESVYAAKLYHAEGPEPYSASDVAQAFSCVLQKNVEVIEIPEEQWISTLSQIGFSDEAAQSMAGMTKIVARKEYEIPENPWRGRTSLQSYIKQALR